MRYVAKAAAPLLAAALLLSGCGSDSAQELPQDYVLGEDSLPALNSLVTLDSGFQFQEIEGEEGEDSVTYVYSKLSNGGQTTQEYVKALEEEYDCTVGADESSSTPPNFAGSSGQALLLQEQEDSDECFMLTIQWEETSCSVTPSLVPKDEAPQPEEDSVTMEQAVDHLESMSPSDLGLSGSSMEEYTVIPQDGLVLLDDQSCLCVNIYLTETHQFQQSYLLTLPELQVYCLNRETGQATALQ